MIVEVDTVAIWYWDDSNDRLIIHRDGNPAVLWNNGIKSWNQNGLSHRTDGPFSDHPSGYKKWSIEGMSVWPEL